ncbi:hypothetical protein QP166_16120 [Sphingomonas sp. LR60]|uniref:hypothetical protein n=1 Tax=Sphingomonas sp. LR60 TaxID=3050233 RepID=UPI002FE38263
MPLRGVELPDHCRRRQDQQQHDREQRRGRGDRGKGARALEAIVRGRVMRVMVRLADHRHARTGDDRDLPVRDLRHEPGRHQQPHQQCQRGEHDQQSRRGAKAGHRKTLRERG